MKLSRIASMIFCLVVAAGCQTTGMSYGAPGGGPASSEPMNVAGTAFPPVGFNDFCARHPAECDEASSYHAVVELTDERWDELVEVNHRVNRTIRYVPDKVQFGVPDYWQLSARAGDCEDFALAKKKELEKRGWPKGSLLIGLGHSQRWGYHAMLIVVTDQGDLALDNNTDRIVPWNQTDMQWTMRQSPDHPGQWERVINNA